MGRNKVFTCIRLSAYGVLMHVPLTYCHVDSNAPLTSLISIYERHFCPSGEQSAISLLSYDIKKVQTCTFGARFFQNLRQD